MLGIPDANDLALQVLRILEMRSRMSLYKPEPEAKDKLDELRETKSRNVTVAATIRRLASQGYGYTEIANELNKAGLKSSLGGKFYPTTVRTYAQKNNIGVNTLYKRGRKVGTKLVKR